MSMISKLFNPSNFKNVLSLATSNIHSKLTSIETNIQRYYSHRYTYCNNCKINRKCNKPKNKPKKTPNRCPVPGGKCIPFQNEKKPTKKQTNERNSCNSRKCKPSMRNICDGSEFGPHCTLTTGHRQWSCNECPKDESNVKPCPKGNWDRHSA